MEEARRRARRRRLGYALAALAALLVALGIYLGSGDGEPGAEGTPTGDPGDVPIGEVQIDTNPLREIAADYCGGPGRLGDLARIVGLPASTQSVDRIARSYGGALASSRRGQRSDSPAAVEQAAYEGCLTGLRSKAPRDR